jgi:quercetin dioxygenase-like cupin family protein
MSEKTLPRFISQGETRDEYNDWTLNEWLCRPDLTDSNKLLMVRATMQPRCCHPFHVHPHREEIIHVVSGKAEQWVGNEYRILGAGEVAIIPPGVPHGTYNPFDEILVFHAILSPSVLPEHEASQPDPHDVSETEPWRSARDGLTPCAIAGKAGGT